jgi:hypothetical protein
VVDLEMRFPMQRREICRNHVVDVDEIDVLIRGANDLDGPGPHSRGRPVREDMRRFERMDMRKHRTQPDRAGRACLKHLRFARVSGPVCKPGRGSGRIREIKPIDGEARAKGRRRCGDYSSTSISITRVFVTQCSYDFGF